MIYSAACAVTTCHQNTLIYLDLFFKSLFESGYPKLSCFPCINGLFTFLCYPWHQINLIVYPGSE